MELEIASLIVILLILVFLATIDTAFVRMSDVALRRLATDAEDAGKTSSAALLREIIENRPRFRLVLSSAIQILLIAFTVILTLVVKSFVEDNARLLVLALLFALASTVVVRQVIPRLLVNNNTEQKLLFLLPVIGPLYSLSRLVVPFTPPPTAREKQKLDITAAPDAADDRSDEAADDFQALMEVGEAEGIIEESEREMIETMVELSDTRAGEIMTPRTEICALPITATIRDARDLINEQKYSRIPVYRDSIDNIEGILYVRDLLQTLSEGSELRPVSEILRDAYFVPETKPANELLKSMQQNHVQIAIVIDEYGGVAGVVSIEDILEEIVGEIEDEDIEDEEIIEIVEGSDGYWDVLGSTDIDKIERLFDIDFDDDDFTTVAGFVTSEAGYVPHVGDKLIIRGLEIEVLRGDQKRLQLLRLRPAQAADAAAETS